MNNTVKCSNGSFIGDESEDLIVWRGIPYATQPVGDLRWKKALPLRTMMAPTKRSNGAIFLSARVTIPREKRNSVRTALF